MRSCRRCRLAWKPVRVHLVTHGAELPGCVEQDFDDHLKCGCLERGLPRVRCDTCHGEHLLAFSCKPRGFCPGCGARCMAESAALLVDEVFPERAARQSVLRVPYPLRFLFASRRAFAPSRRSACRSQQTEKFVINAPTLLLGMAATGSSGSTAAHCTAPSERQLSWSDRSPWCGPLPEPANWRQFPRNLRFWKFPPPILYASGRERISKIAQQACSVATPSAAVHTRERCRIGRCQSLQHYACIFRV